ncbi:hypothetical protein OPIT5_02985 [Opitutaceae bacterium TAV5]|nr:hypothetical protein OPIT5_02985 [Opitutaceae bacterium TAV5]
MTPGLPFRIFSLVSLACLLAASGVRLPADEILKTDFADGTVHSGEIIGEMISRFGSVYAGSGNNNPRFAIRDVRVNRTSATPAR